MALSIANPAKRPMPCVAIGRSGRPVECRASPRPSPASPRSPSTVVDGAQLSWAWQGSDEFSGLRDRRDSPPLPLPPVAAPTRVVLIRHGQSTWNARNRIQGSSNFAMLTPQGLSQAEVSRERLAEWELSCMFCSPLTRAAETAEVVWGSRTGPVTVLPSLREIDLYSFQGWEKAEARGRFPEQYAAWQQNPASLVLDGHAPVRELWYRASLAWHDMLQSPTAAGRTALVVAHNAINKALLCTALGLPPTYFRRFTQTNAAITVLDFLPPKEAGGPTAVRVDRTNQFPDAPTKPERPAANRRVTPRPHRLVLVAGDAAARPVQASLQLLAANGIQVPPLICVGNPQQQALDVSTALQAVLGTAGESRTVLAVASPAACQLLLTQMLEEPAECTERRKGHVGSAFEMTPGGVTILIFPARTATPCPTDLFASIVLCTNYQYRPNALGKLGQQRQQQRSVSGSVDGEHEGGF